MYRPVPSIGSKSCLWVVGWMYQVDVYLRVRRAVMVDGMSIWEVSRVFGLHRDTVRKILAYSVPPGYRRQTPPRRPNPSTSSGVPYSTRPSGSLCRATYSDHEGLDFIGIAMQQCTGIAPRIQLTLNSAKVNWALVTMAGNAFSTRTGSAVKGGEKVYHCGVDVQRLCQGNGPAIMSVVAVSSQ